MTPKPQKSMRYPEETPLIRVLTEEEALMGRQPRTIGKRGREREHRIHYQLDTTTRKRTCNEFFEPGRIIYTAPNERRCATWLRPDHNGTATTGGTSPWPRREPLIRSGAGRGRYTKCATAMIRSVTSMCSPAAARYKAPCGKAQARVELYDRRSCGGH